MWIHVCVGDGTLGLDRHNCTHENLDFLTNKLISYTEIYYTVLCLRCIR